MEQCLQTVFCVGVQAVAAYIPVGHSSQVEQVVSEEPEHSLLLYVPGSQVLQAEHSLSWFNVHGRVSYSVALQVVQFLQTVSLSVLHSDSRY